MTFAISDDKLEIWIAPAWRVQIGRAAATLLLRFLLAWLGLGAGYQSGADLAALRRRQGDRALLLARLDAGQEIGDAELAWLIGATPDQRRFGLTCGGGEVVS